MSFTNNIKYRLSTVLKRGSTPIESKGLTNNPR